YVKDYLQSADIAIVNLEVPLAGKPYSGYPQFSAPDALAAYAKEAGFDIMTTDNNHCMDRGKKGLERTLFALDSLGIPHLGTYLNRAQHDAEHPLMVERNGFRLALLTYTYGTNEIPVPAPLVANMIDTTVMADDLAEAMRMGAEYVITLIHWGIEYDTVANRQQRELAKFLLSHGSDIVIGGHPHVVQDATMDALPDNDKTPEIVVYSMGNLISNQRFRNTDGGIMVELELRRDGDKIHQDCGYMPYWVYRGVYNGLYQYYILPTRAARQDPKKFQLSKEDIDALILFDDNTRERLNGSIKEVSAY
ncbi:MAG: CapA family protein, partial [Bacteroidales bacterium]|nr:CapA family protein [Bacteroidales bacterium]